MSAQQYYLGYVHKPFDPKEQRYMRARFAGDPAKADLTKYVGLVDEKHDSRAPIGNQGDEGSCAAWDSTQAVFAGYQEALWRAGDPLVALRLAPGPIYEQARKVRGWWPGDSGSIPSDCFDILMVDCPKFDDYPYVAVPDHEYNWDQNTAAPKLNYIQSLQPIYTGQPDTVQQIVLALAAGLPVSIGMYWPNAFFNPVRGVLPEGVNWTPGDGEHGIYLWGYYPAETLNGIALPARFGVQNQWGDGWSIDAPQSGKFARAGDFLIPVDYFGAGGPIQDLRAVSPDPVPVIPPTPPAPPPQPLPIMVSRDAVIHALDDGIAQIAADKTRGANKVLNRTNGANALATIVESKI